MEKTGILPLESTDAEAAYWDTVLEPLVKKEFTNRTGLKICKHNAMMQHSKHVFMLANVDGILKDKEGMAIFEAKTASEYKSDQWKHGVPPEYQLQAQHCMEVIGYNKAYIAVLIGGNKFVYYGVKRDNNIINPMIKMEQKFWEHVKNRTPPGIDGLDDSTEYLNNLFQGSSHTSIILPESTMDIIRDYEETTEHIKNLTDHKEELANKMKFLLKENEEGIVGNRKIKWISVQNERLDQKKLRNELPEIYGKYVTTQSYRRFSID